VRAPGGDGSSPCPDRTAWVWKRSTLQVFDETYCAPADLALPALMRWRAWRVPCARNSGSRQAVSSVHLQCSFCRTWGSATDSRVGVGCGVAQCAVSPKGALRRCADANKRPLSSPLHGSRRAAAGERLVSWVAQRLIN